MSLAGCQRITAHEPVLPAELLSLAEHSRDAEPRWAVLEIQGENGPLRVRVPVLLFTGGAGEPARIDTVALAAVERRLLGRMGAIARAEAAAVLEREGFAVAAPELVAEIRFSPGDTLLDRQGARDARSAASRLSEVPGAVEVHALATGPEAAGIAVARARAVWSALVEAEPDLADRDVRLSGGGHADAGRGGASAEHVERVQIRSLPYVPR